jgi:hypothetical protein
MARTVCAAVIDAEGCRCAVEVGYFLSQLFDASLVRPPLRPGHDNWKRRGFPILLRAMEVRFEAGDSGCSVAGVRGSFALVLCLLPGVDAERFFLRARCEPFKTLVSNPYSSSLSQLNVRLLFSHDAA